MSDADRLRSTLKHINIDGVLAGVCDLNGILRGKRIPLSQIDKVMEEGLKMPLSLVGVDIWGEDVLGNGQVLETGDADITYRPTGRGPLIQSWHQTPTALIPLQMTDETGIPLGPCPRSALDRVLGWYRDQALTVVCAMELEFHLVARDDGRPTPITAHRLKGAPAIEAIDELEAREGFLAEVYEVAATWDIDLGSALSEGGAGQFEIVLNHKSDPLAIADSTYFLKRIIRGVAAKHGFEATFMAKPFENKPGNGFHTHFSLVDADGSNIFDDGGELGSDPLRHAVSGLESMMAETMLIFAPHMNSFRRFAPASHAPTTIAWGYDNRLAALRIPQSEPKARRVEHRVSGADANPYLVLAAILAAVRHGLETRSQPSAPVAGNVYEADRPHLPATWRSAIDVFASNEALKDAFDPRLIAMFLAAKRQEQGVFSERIPLFEYETYVDVV
ncbi:MAG: glutamine synthetase family protein [Pseudomonadota bacterium]